MTVLISAMEFRLLDLVWEYQATPLTRTVDVHVASLRQKTEPVPSHPRHIVIVHRVGYRFDAAPAEATSHPATTHEHE